MIDATCVFNNVNSLLLLLASNKCRGYLRQSYALGCAPRVTILARAYYIVLPYKPNISLIHSILYYKLFAYICKFLYLYNIILADIYA